MFCLSEDRICICKRDRILILPRFFVCFMLKINPRMTVFRANGIIDHSKSVCYPLITSTGRCFQKHKNDNPGKAR